MHADRGESLSEDRRGVTAVVGVILMVGLTVLTASVVGSLTLGMADAELQEPRPTVGISFDYDVADGTVTVVHAGGQRLERGELSVLQSGKGLSLASGPSFGAGDRIVIAKPYAPGERIVVVWEGSGGDTAVIAASDTPA